MPFHDEARDLVRGPAAALVAVGGMPLRRGDEGWSLGGLAADPALFARVREAQREAMGHAAAMTYLNPRDLSPEALVATMDLSWLDEVLTADEAIELLTAELEKVRLANEGKDKNRNGILLANPDCPQTKTLTHSMWSLYNLLPAKSKQKAHRHNSIALDFAVKATEGVYTMIGRDLDSDGNIINPVRANWVAGGAFVTPPGWWHSHHNESDEDAIVLPVQDAGLHTYLQTLDIQFAHGY